MEISFIADKKIWNDFVARHALDGGFLQSWEWGEFQEKLGRKVWRMAVSLNGQIQTVALL
ncbi:hypothetical protein HY224_03225, partial [Candidatus Uhrbacteria bacterium]|nr:hypothetical protein [Candidatus Uhrbacteria bacterium]